MMRTAEQVAELRAACESWRGTPFVPNSCVKGAGVCCHKFAAAVYFEAGWLHSISVPDGNPYGSEVNSGSPFEDWLDSSPLFEDFDPMRTIAGQPPEVLRALLSAGDLVLSKPSRAPWHLAVYLGAGTFAHVDIRQGVQITDALPDVWAKKIVRIYRPKETPDANTT